MNKYLEIISYSLILLAGIDGNQLEAKDHQNIPNYKQTLQEYYSVNNQLKQAKEFYEQGEYEQAIALLKTAINQSKKAGNILLQSQGLLNLSLIYLKQSNWPATEKNLNQFFQLINKINNQAYRNKLTNYALEIKGELELAVGQPEKALNTWEESGKIAYNRGDIQPFIQAQIKQIQALQELGMYGKAANILENIKPQLEAGSQNLIMAQAWLTYGNISSKLGQLQSAKESLNQALNIARDHQNNELISSIILAQGHLSLSENRVQIRKPNQQIDRVLQATRNYYQQAAAITNNPSFQINAQLSELNLLVSYNRQNISDNFIDNLTTKINNLPISKSLINQRIHFALNLIRLNQNDYNSLILHQLTQAHQESEILNYQRGKSEALGSLAKLYQQSQRLKEAQELTEKALYIAGLIEAPDLAYQWQWQLGKIFWQQNNRKEAISAYSGAVNTLKSLRSELVGVNSDLEFNFRENVEPVYRELVSILLRSEATPTEIRQARDVIEALQIAELDNFFRTACLEGQIVPLEQVNQTAAAVVYPIILPDRLEVILSLPGQSLRHYATDIPQSEVESTLKQLRLTLEKPYTAPEGKVLLQKVYDWLVRPAETDLAQTQVETLVFVLDGALRNVPMAALYDGKQYLVKRYSVALAPGLQLLAPQPLRRRGLEALAGGLTEERGRFGALPNVGRELAQIQSVVPSQILLNQAFTSTALREQLAVLPFPVVHLATHGQFSSNAEETFILAWDRPIKVNELDALLRASEPTRSAAIELLVLSACETAAGDERAALGLAGVAVRSGARSTLASLWSLDDESGAYFFSQFYRELASAPVTKAEALRRAQLSLLQDPDYRHPVHWAPYVLVGNWL